MKNNAFIKSMAGVGGLTQAPIINGLALANLPKRPTASRTIPNYLANRLAADFCRSDPTRLKRKPFPISPVNPQICVGGALDTLAVLRDGGTHVTARLRP